MSSLVGALLTQVFLFAAPQPTTPPPQSLATAAELLAERGMAKACATVTKMGLAEQDAPDAERVRLYLVSAIQLLKDGDEAAARKAMEEALKIDRGAQLPPFATADARSLLEDVRARLPVKPKRPHPKSHMVYPPNGEPYEAPDEPVPARPREPPARALTRAFDALYQDMQELDGPGLLVDLAERAQPLAKEDQAQLTIRRGILLMEEGEEARAKTAFQQAQDLDPKAKPPDYVPPKTLRAFDEVRRKNALLKEGDQATRKAKAQPATVPAGPHLEPVSTTMMVSGGVVAVTGLIVFIATSQSSTTSPGSFNTGQIAGGAIAVIGVVAVAGGYIVSQQPELVSVRLGVSPIDRGGLLVAAGHF